MKWKVLLIYACACLSLIIFFAYQWNAIQNVAVNEARYPPDIADDHVHNLTSDMNAEAIVRRLFHEKVHTSKETAKAAGYSMEKALRNSDFKFRLLALAMRADGITIAVVSARKSDGAVFVRSYVKGDDLPNGMRILEISKNFLKYKSEDLIKILWLFHEN